MLLEIKLKRCLKKKAEFEHSISELYEGIKMDMWGIAPSSLSDFMELDKSYVSQIMHRGIILPLRIKNLDSLGKIATALARLNKKRKALSKLNL